MTWTVGRRIAGGFTFLLALVVVVAGVGYVTLRRTTERLSDLIQRETALLDAATRARSGIRDAERALLNFLLTGDLEDVANRQRSLQTAASALTDLRSQLATGAAEGRSDSLRAELDRWRSLTDEVIAAGQRQGVVEARKVRDQRVPPAVFVILRDEVDAQVTVIRQSIDGLARDATEAADRARLALVVAGALALGLGVLAGLLLYRGVSAPLRETTGVLASSAAEILAATSQQASGATESSAAVAETVATVEQVAQIAEQTSQRAKAVAEAARQAAEIGVAGRRVIESSTESMAAVREQVESIAESIVALAEQAQAIGEIIATVNDIAEQTNLLAINAAVEAARAGDQGRGFSVVAGEIKNLAEQSKKATVQVRQILGQIQRATTAAVMSTEQGTKQVGSTVKQVAEAGQTIQTLADAVTEAAKAAAQIMASAGQQAAGMSQIRQAMASVHDATQQMLASTRQSERAAEELNGLGGRLLHLVGGNHRTAQNRTPPR